MDSNVDLQHAFTADWLIFRTNDRCLKLTAVFTGTSDISHPMFIIEYARDDKERIMKMYVTREQLEFLTTDPLVYGRNGHLTVCEISTGVFCIRDEFAWMCPFSKESTTGPIRVNGFVHKQIKMAAKEIFEDIDLLARMVQQPGSCEDVGVLTDDDKTLIRRFGLACAREIYAKNTGSNSAARKVYDALLNVDHKQLNEFLKPSRLSVPENVKFNLYGRLENDTRYNFDRVASECVTYPSMSWSRHNYHCYNKECVEDF